ncbi:MAG: hypothetical protein M1826_005233 [Phylliscum demangeonii]|nr:MAG: hypothetical protein M1826_005233 [Phylliscum demangeonii]
MADSQPVPQPEPSSVAVSDDVSGTAPNPDTDVAMGGLDDVHDHDPHPPPPRRTVPSNNGRAHPHTRKDDAPTAGPSGAISAGRDRSTAAAGPAAVSKKETTLRDFLDQMDDYAPIIPDAVTNYYLTTAGLPPPPQTPIQLARLLALATQKFIADIAADAYQYSRIRASNTSAGNNPMGGLAGAGVGAAGPGGNAAGAGGGAGAKDGSAAAVAAAAVAAAAAQQQQQGGKGGHVLGVQRPGYGGGGQGGSHGRAVLMMEDLGMAVGEYGVNLRRGEFYR